MSDKEKKLSIEQKNEISDSLNSFLEEIKSSSIDDNKKDQIETKIWELEEKMNTLKDADNLISSIEDDLKVLKEYTEFQNSFRILKEKLSQIEKEVIEPQKNELNNLKKQVLNSNWLDPKNIDPQELLEHANNWRKKHSNDLHNLAKSISAKWGFWSKIAKLAENTEKFFW